MPPVPKINRILKGPILQLRRTDIREIVSDWTAAKKGKCCGGFPNVSRSPGYSGSGKGEDEDPKQGTGAFSHQAASFMLSERFWHMLLRVSQESERRCRPENIFSLIDAIHDVIESRPLVFEYSNTIRLFNGEIMFGLHIANLSHSATRRDSEELALFRLATHIGFRRHEHQRAAARHPLLIAANGSRRRYFLKKAQRFRMGLQRRSKKP
jgi:hypothetical protein